VLEINFIALVRLLICKFLKLFVIVIKLQLHVVLVIYMFVFMRIILISLISIKSASDSQPGRPCSIMGQHCEHSLQLISFPNSTVAIRCEYFEKEFNICSFMSTFTELQVYETCPQVWQIWSANWFSEAPTKAISQMSNI